MTCDTLEFISASALYLLLTICFFTIIFSGIEVWWGGNRNLKNL